MDALRGLHWLPSAPDLRSRLAGLQAAPDRAACIALSRSRLDFLATNALDRLVQRLPQGDPAADPIRLALLGSSTLAHLHAGIRIGGLRRGLQITLHEGEYGQYRQDLADPGAALHGFAPDAMLLALDAHHLTASCAAADLHAAAAQVLDHLIHTWRAARTAFGCTIVQQTLLPVFPALLGSNEHLLASRAAIVQAVNAGLREAAASEGVLLLALDQRAARDGLYRWHDPALWLRARQEVSPLAAPVYGDLAARLLGALRGRSAKVLVLDLDNTLWGGTIGDDGLEGIVLGHGSAEGEAFLAVQHHARLLAERGVILAVCSKNDDSVARGGFSHPDMVLRLPDIACFVANWDDKAANLARIAAELNVGLESLVLLDDSAFERDRVRQALPMVAVPELPDDPALYPATLADAGYFEAAALTQDDRARTAHYHANQARTAARAQAGDLDEYLRDLRMRLLWRRVDAVGLPRVVQLLAKTNQFNLTTRRHDRETVQAMLHDPGWLLLQFRLIDRLGDNGIIAVVIGRLEDGALSLDSWLMSCRVLGRGVERAILQVVRAQAAALGARQITGEYRATARNQMVRLLYPGLGFTPDASHDGATRYVLALGAPLPPACAIAIEEE